MIPALRPTISFCVCKILGIGLLFALWLDRVEVAGFFLILFITVMTLLRWRIPRLWPTIVLDGVALWIFGEYGVLSLFVVSELFYRAWEAERKRGLYLRDIEAHRYYELERLQSDLLAASAQIENMTAVAERTRIARDIHDNAGHEIIAAYISFQTVRTLLTTEDAETLAFYDNALERLDKGANKIRESVHNLSAVTALGVDNLRDICKAFPRCDVAFSTFGDTSKIPVHAWGMLEACLNECLTNIAKHTLATRVSVSLDTTQHIIRLDIENNGVTTAKNFSMGSGLRNLRYRAAAVGGSFSAHKIEKEEGTFRAICVLPITRGGDNE